MEYIIDRKWKWVQCNLVIKRLPQKQYQQGLYQSLQAQVQLISEEPDIKNFQSDIIMEKSFEFEEGRGFIWHKSWYIPEIIIKLSSKVTKMLKQQNHIKKIYCEMLSAYPYKKDQHFYLQQIKLDGQTVRQFSKKGQVSFTNVKFSQTSFNKNKNKFSLILVIYTSHKQTQKCIIKSYISSPIHVDSRKQARKKISANTFIQDQINLNKFINSLQGSQKLLNQLCAYQDLLTIPGFIKYYTAANIRFKIKHPYYIGYHFDNIFDVYYNSQQATDPVNVLQLIYENETKQSDRVKIKPRPKKDTYTDNKQILKKTCPKILLFMIKNRPRQCYLIKDQVIASQQKISLQQQQNSSRKKLEQSKQKIQLQKKGSNILISIAQEKQNKDQQLGNDSLYNSLPIITITPADNNNKQQQQIQTQMQNSNLHNNENNQNNQNLQVLGNGQIPFNSSSSFIYSPEQFQNAVHPMNSMNNTMYYMGNHNPQHTNAHPNVTSINLYSNFFNCNNQNKFNYLWNNNTLNFQGKTPQNLQCFQEEVKNIQNQEKQVKQEQQQQQQDVFEIKNEQAQKTQRELNKEQQIKQQEFIKKIYSIFESWKFNFVYIKKSDGGLTVLNKKWVHIPKEQLHQSFKVYTQKKSQKVNQNDRGDSGPPAPNGNNYLTYDIHQVIDLQRSRHTVKVQQNFTNY